MIMTSMLECIALPILSATAICSQTKACIAISARSVYQ